MRTRTTWQGKGSETARQAATHRRADIYDMNFGGPRVQPSPDQYMAPDAGPDAWAETPASYDSVAKEYDAKGHVIRNEIGMPEFRENTFQRPSWGDEKKYDNRTASERKANAAHRLASSLLKTSDQGLVRKVALGFMSMPDSAVVTALRAVDSASPKSLPDDVRFKRALACTKLAASMLGDTASEDSVERVARSIYEVDDPTLRSIIKNVAMAKIAQQEQEEQEEEQEEEEQGSKKKPAHTAQQQEQEEQEEEEAEGHQAGGWAKKHSNKPVAQQQEEEEEQEEEEQQEGMHSAAKHSNKPVAQQQEQEEQEEEQEEEEQECGPMASGHTGEEQEEGDLDAVTSAMLAEMNGGESGGFPAMMPAAPATPMMPAAPAAPMMPVASSLEALFADDPEVRASRELRGQGYEIGRTASAKGAKKLGSVRAASAKAPEFKLENLWDRT
jgi:hypothetical protein